MEASRRRSNALWATLVVSLILHLGLVPALYTLFVNDPVPSPKAKEHLDAQQAIHILSQKQVKRLTAPAAKPVVRPPEPRPEKKPEPVQRPDGQVVDLPDEVNAVRPKDARFLSETDNQVEKEQVAARKEAASRKMVKSDRRVISPGDDVRGTRKGKSRQAQRTEAVPRPKRPKPGDSDRKGKAATEPIVKQREAPRQAADQLPDGEGRFRPQSTAEKRPPAQPSGGDTVGGSSPPDGWRSLLPTLGPRDATASSGSIDHIEGVDEGEQTFLNTREYRYAFFFNRVKKNVRERWRAAQVHRQHDPHGRIFGVRDRLTVVQVTLSPHGDLDDVIITKDSGVAFLDEAAIDAFRAAQPFPNPPDGLQDPDGRIRFRFGFFLEINSGGFRLFRSR